MRRLLDVEANIHPDTRWRSGCALHRVATRLLGRFDEVHTVQSYELADGSASPRLTGRYISREVLQLAPKLEGATLDRSYRLRRAGPLRVA
jgi:hypothetical protein